MTAAYRCLVWNQRSVLQ